MTTSRTTTIHDLRHHLGRRLGRKLGIVALAVVATVGVGACGVSVDGEESARNAATDTTVTTESTVAPSTTTDDATDPDESVSNDGGSNDGGSNGGGSTGGGSAGNSGGNPGGGNAGGGGTSTSPAPKILDFTTPETIDCHNGNFQQFTASWNTQGATKVTISIDGPGIYDTYGPSGSTSLPFSCDQSHTFLLTAHSADGKTATEQINLQPRNAQGPMTTDDGE